jgi:hypothetical protein
LLLRRVAEHVQAQNWTAIVIDFIIVVVGILLAFQITDWNEQRQNDDTRVLYLSQLVEDLREDILEAERVKQIALVRMSVIDDMFDVIGREPLSRRVEGNFGAIEFDTYEPFDVASNGDSPLFDVPRFKAIQDTYSAVVSNGDFKLLDSPSLVRQIQRYYGGVDEAGRLDSSLYQVFWYVSESYFRHGLDGTTDFDDLIDALRNDRRLVAELESFWYYSGFQADWMNYVIESGTKLIEVIEAGE